jgi:RNA recognition motif-containing protein
MTNLFVRIGGIDRNTPLETRIELIQDLFAPYVEIAESSIKIIKDREFGGFRNFLFVEIDDDEVANSIIDALDKTTTDEGYDLSINVAEDREKPSSNNNSGGYKKNNFSKNNYSKGNNYKSNYNNNRY